jgi:transposase
MTPEEEVISLREENQILWERVLVQQEQIEVQQSAINQQQRVIEGLQQQTERLSEQVQPLQERLKKDSHNSHLPPSSNRFHRQPKSLRQRSGKQTHFLWHWWRIQQSSQVKEERLYWLIKKGRSLHDRCRHAS